MAASDFAKTYHEKAETLLKGLLNELPGLPAELRDESSPQFEVALSFSMGHVLHHSMMDVEADRVASDAESVCEKLLMHGHARSSQKLREAIATLGTARYPETGSCLEEPHRSVAVLLGIAQSPSGTGSHLDAFARDQASKSEEHAGSSGMLASGTTKKDEAAEEDESDVALRELLSAQLGEWSEDFQSESEDDDAEEREAAALHESNRQESSEEEGSESSSSALPKSFGDRCLVGVAGGTGGVRRIFESDHDDEHTVAASQGSGEATHHARRMAARRFGHEALSSHFPSLDNATAGGVREVSNAAPDVGSRLSIEVRNVSADTTPSTAGDGAALKFMSSLSCQVVSEAEVIRGVLHALQGLPCPFFVPACPNALLLQYSAAARSTRKSGAPPPWAVQPITSREALSAAATLTSVLSSHASSLTGSSTAAAGGGGGAAAAAAAAAAPPLPPVRSVRCSHLSERAVRRCLEKHASHASDLRFLRSFLPQAQMALPGVFGRSGGEEGGGSVLRAGATAAAWVEEVTTWLVSAEEQLVGLEAIAYLGDRERQAPAAAASPSSRMFWGDPSLSVEPPPPMGVRAWEVPAATHGRGPEAASSSGGGGARKKWAGGCVATLLQLECALGPSAKRARELRLMCERLLLPSSPTRALSSSTSSSTSVPHQAAPGLRSEASLNGPQKKRGGEDGGAARAVVVVGAAVRVLDGLWEALHAAEAVQREKPIGPGLQEEHNSNGTGGDQKQQVEGRPKGPAAAAAEAPPPLPLPPPAAASSPWWLRKALANCLKPLLGALSSWCLEGRVHHSLHAETFLSLCLPGSGSSSSGQRLSAVAATSAAASAAAVSGGVEPWKGVSTVSAERLLSDAASTLSAALPGLPCAGGSSHGVVPSFLSPLAPALVSCGHAVALMRSAYSPLAAHTASSRGAPATSTMATSHRRGWRWTECGQWVEAELHKALLAHRGVGPLSSDPRGIETSCAVFVLETLFEAGSQRHLLSGKPPRAGSTAMSSEPLKKEGGEVAVEDEEEEERATTDSEASEEDEDEDEEDPLFEAEASSTFLACGLEEALTRGKHKRQSHLASTLTFSSRTASESPFFAPFHAREQPTSPEARAGVTSVAADRLGSSPVTASAGDAAETTEASPCPCWPVSSSEEAAVGGRGRAGGGGGGAEEEEHLVSSLSSHEWLFASLVKPLARHCAEAEGAAAHTLRQGMSSHAATAAPSVGEAGEGEGGLLGALSVLRAVFLMSDSELLSEFRGTLFAIAAPGGGTSSSSSFGEFGRGGGGSFRSASLHWAHLDASSSSSSNLGGGSGGGGGGGGVPSASAWGSSSLAAHPSAGLLAPRPFSAAALTALLRRSVTETLAPRQDQQEQLQQQHQEGVLGRKAERWRHEEEAASTPPFHGTHDADQAFGGGVPLSFVDDSKSRARRSWGEHSSSSVCFGLNLDDFSVALVSPPGNARSQQPRSREDDLHTTLISLPAPSPAAAWHRTLPHEDGIKQLGRIRLCCRAAWPLVAVVTPRALEQYGKAFGLLLKVKYALSALEGIRWHLLKHRRRDGLSMQQGARFFHSRPGRHGGGGGEWHRLGLEHGVVLHVVSSLHGYLATHCAATQWARLTTSLRAASSVAEMRSAHDAYLHTILERCMLLPRAAKVLEYIHRVLSGALQFATLLTSLHYLEQEEEEETGEGQSGGGGRGGRPYYGDGATTSPTAMRPPPGHSRVEERRRKVAKELVSCFASFVQDLKYVHAVGERLVATRLAPYLADVLLVLDFNGFFQDTLTAY